MTDLMDIARQAMPEIPWELDEEGDAVALVKNERYGVFKAANKQGVFAASHTKLGSEVKATFNVEWVRILADKGLGVKFNPFGLGFVRGWEHPPSSEEIAQFYKDTNEIWDTFSEQTYIHNT